MASLRLTVFPGVGLITWVMVWEGTERAGELTLGVVFTVTPEGAEMDKEVVHVIGKFAVILHTTY